eukprot:TRINITY_DN9945_c0_g1_i2.p1 TRINITY_DN9945_c0_g1~~TRINITY_DN9945_c0_g1_i2.p1  ORF type:complete len:653 (-),score=111.38 TRINITY_DN9945_c0_g1_i2:545-2503(-)
MADEAAGFEDSQEVAAAEAACTQAVDDSTMLISPVADDSTMLISPSKKERDGVSSEAAPSETSNTGPPRLAAYTSRRQKTLKHQRPTAVEKHHERNAAFCAQVHPFEGLQHQVLPARNNPHPYEGSQLRWPHELAGGGAHPLDDRRHEMWFAYREARWIKGRHWTDGPKYEGGAELVVDFRLKHIVDLLIKVHGSIEVGFDDLDCINKNGRISETEWKEGVYHLIADGKGPDFNKYKPLLFPRSSWDKRMQGLFRQVDKDRDGFIVLDELLYAASQAEIQNVRKDKSAASVALDLNASLKSSRSAAKLKPTRSTALLPKPLSQLALTSTLSATDLTNLTTIARPGVRIADIPYSPDTRSFAALLRFRFNSLEQAYKFFDGNDSQDLSYFEFEAAAKDLRFGLCPRTVFKELDTDGGGTIGLKEFKVLETFNVSPDDIVTFKTNRDAAAEKKMRSPIQPPSKFQRGVCLAGSHVSRPQGEYVSSSAHYYSFNRAPTGRLDLLQHPVETPGADQEQFSSEHGPGYVKKGPEHFPGVNCHVHPLNGNKFKFGGTMNREERFGPAIPSYEGRQDLENAARCFLAGYEGRRPKDTGPVVCGTGATSMVSKRERVGKTHGTSDSFGLLGPQPIGPWGESRLTLKLKSMSEPSLLHLPT